MKEKMVDCEDCGGSGQYDKFHDLIDIHSGVILFQTKMCIRCRGIGQLNHVDNIVGKHTYLLKLELLDHSSEVIKGYKDENWRNTM